MKSIQLTSEEIDIYRAQWANNPVLLDVLNVIEEWDGDLADATESLAIRNGIEGVQDKADFRWFFMLLQKCQSYVCQDKFENLTKKQIPALIPPIADLIAGNFGCPPGTAGIIATPVAIYIQEEGMDKFCQMKI